jgi:hypothetical protein
MSCEILGHCQQDSSTHAPNWVAINEDEMLFM